VFAVGDKLGQLRERLGWFRVALTALEADIIQSSRRRGEQLTRREQAEDFRGLEIDHQIQPWCAVGFT